MPTTVNAAFAQFLTDAVNLDGDVVKVARASRDWLVRQIHALPDTHGDVPALWHDIDLHYGSFARRTKIRELDDIDLLVGLAGKGTTYAKHGGQVRLTVPDGIALRSLCHDGTALLHSEKVINAFVRALGDVPQYEQAAIVRNGSAAVLKLKSYPWTFDIVPGFQTEADASGRSYYVIPDGARHWKFTDPEVDSARMTAINQAHEGNVLHPVRLMKYWNRRPTMPTVPSYAFECLLMSHYDARATHAPASRYPDVEVIHLLEYVVAAVYGSIPDPKGIQGDLNTLTWKERSAVAARSAADLMKARDALAAEQRDDHRAAIRHWGDVFGRAFPSYG